MKALAKLRYFLGLLLVLFPVEVWAIQIDYLPTTKTDTKSSAQSATALWTPASGNGIYLWGCMASMDRIGSVRFQSNGTDVIPPIYFTTGGSVSYGFGGSLISYISPGNTLTYTSTFGSAAATNASVACSGIEK